MAIKNTVFIDFYVRLSIVDDVFHCLLPGVLLLSKKCDWSVYFSREISRLCMIV